MMKGCMYVATDSPGYFPDDLLRAFKAPKGKTVKGFQLKATFLFLQAVVDICNDTMLVSHTFTNTCESIITLK